VHPAQKNPASGIQSAGAVESCLAAKGVAVGAGASDSETATAAVETAGRYHFPSPLID